MKKTLFLLIGTFVLLFAILYIFKGSIGDIRPAVLPPTSGIKETAVTGFGDIDNELGAAQVNGLKAPKGFIISFFAKDLGNARDLEFSPGGTLLLSIPGSGKVVALPDRDSNGSADENKTILSRLNKPHGIAFFEDKLFVVEETKVVRYNWDEENLKAEEDKKLFDLPKGGRHFTRTIAFNKDGQMFISLGSTCDVCYEKNEWIAAVITSDSDGASPRLFASGLRNAVFITTHPKTGELWGTEMGRDFLGDNKPPDEINIIKDGQNYGWPICYGKKVHDSNFDKNIYTEDPCLFTESPIYEIPAHSAPLGLAFINSPQFPSDWQGDLLVAYHGSWNRSVPTGYKVVRMNVDGNTISGEEDFMTGFISGSQANARPVDVIFDSSGNLFVSDDKAGAVYKVQYSPYK